MLGFPRFRALIDSVRKRDLRAVPMALLVGLLVGGAGSALQVAGIASSPLVALDDAAQDLLLRSQSSDSMLGAAGSTPASDPRAFITIVAIDERTIAELGAYNGGYPRSYHAQVVENLLAAPPRVIAFDVGFFESTPDDGLLAAAFEHARSLPVPTTIILGSVGLQPAASAAGASAAGEHVFGSALVPVPMLADNAKLALANIVSDPRGTIRSMPLVAYVQGVEQPTLGLAAAASYVRRRDAFDRHTGASLEFAGRSIPLADDASVHINYLGPPSLPYAPGATFRVVSFVDVLRGRIDPAVWRNGLVMIGASGATGLADDYWTPMSAQGRKMAGVEIHANVAATLFSNRFLTDTPLPAQVLIIISIAVLMALLAAALGAPAVWMVPCLVMGAYVAGSVLAFFQAGLLLPFSTPLLAGLLSVSGAAAVRVASEQRSATGLRADMAFTALHDPLTGLPNRALIHVRLTEAIATARRLNRPCAVLLLDLDNFKQVNESLGHRAGDAVLNEIGHRLAGIVQAQGTLARHGGDEFVLLVQGWDAVAAVDMATRVLGGLKAPIVILDGQEVFVSGSIGIVAYPEHGADADTLLRHAELAMYTAKHRRGSSAIYSADQDREAADSRALVANLRQAIEANQLVLYYQPKVECGSRRLIGMEALARWQHPELGLVGPDRFVGLAETTGQIAPLTRWALDAALAQARAWLDDGFAVPIAVNLSALDVQEPSMPDVIADLLVRWNIPASLLSVELTEGALLADPALALDILQRLAHLGVVASLDDYGSGYSTLAYLKQFPMRELKIDRLLVTDIVQQPRDRMIVRSTIELGHSLGLVVLAEGVEDATTLALLDDLGCDLAQGFFISRPMPAASVRQWARDWSRPVAAC